MKNHACHKVKLYLTFNFIMLVLYLTIKKQIEKIEGANVPLNMSYSLNILNIHIISPILIYVSVISNNKKYELKLL